MSAKTYQKLAATLEDQIRKGELKPMTRLPSERDLAKAHEVSRTTVREALMALEAGGLLQIKDRSGAYVQPVLDVEPGFLSKLEKQPGPHEVLQMRRLIEGESSFLAALNGSNAALKEIAEANEANAAVPPDDTPEFHECTRRFHMSIAKASENSLFHDLLDFLWDQKSGPLWEKWYGSTRSRKNRLIVIASNQEVTDAILARRPQAARTSMQRHIDRMISRFLSY